MSKYHLGLAAILALVLLNQGTFTIDALRDLEGRYPSNTLVLEDPVAEHCRHGCPRERGRSPAGETGLYPSTAGFRRAGWSSVRFFTTRNRAIF